MFIYVNGEVVNEAEVRISPFDHGFLYGIGLFETFRIYGGHPFLLDDHLNRLNQGLKQLNIQTEFRREQVLPMLQQLLNKNNFNDAYIRFNVSAGIGEIGLTVNPYQDPNVLIFSKPLPVFKEEKSIKILNLRRNTPESNTRLKSHHYLNNVLAKREIGADPGLEGVFLTKEGFLAEGIVSNLFWIKENILFTPSIETGILNGVTRMFVIYLAKKLGFSVKEGYFHPEEILNADEVFLTNSIQEIVPVNMFEKCIKPGKQGSKVNLLNRHYQNLRSTLWSRDEIDLGGRSFEK